MALTLEDLDRRVTALELAQSARSENAIARLEQKVDAFPRAVAEMIAELRGKIGATEQRLEARIAESEDSLRGAISISVDASEQRMREVINTMVSGAEQRTAGLINDSEQRILVALGRLKNP
ncbi:MAG: hypothetical protein WAN86_14550 [Hyphomicrobiaceae bacterium]